MYYLILLLLPISLFSREIMVAYFDKEMYTENKLNLQEYPKHVEISEIEQGLIITLAYALNPDPSILSINAGSSLGRFNALGDQTYAYSTYLSARVTPLTILACSPYVELSLAGPTYLSKNTLGPIDFGSSVVYQNFLAFGLKVAAIHIEAKLLNFSTSLPEAFSKKSVTFPLIISAGTSF